MPSPVLSDGRPDQAVEVLQRLLAAQQEVSASLAALPPSMRLFHEILGIVCRTLDWSFGAAWQRDTESETLGCAAVWNAGETSSLGDFAAGALGQRFAIGRGLPGHTWATGSPVWLQDLRWDGRMQSVAAAQSAGLRSAVAVPLDSGAGLEGVLEFFSEEIRQPDAAVMSWLASTGALVAQYLARWRAHETLLARDRALGAAVNGVVISDATQPGFPIVYTNPGFERLTGYTLEEILGRPCSFLQGPETDAATVTEISEALSEARAVSVTLRNYRKDGTPFWNELHLSPVVDEQGGLTQYIGVQNDVTEQRIATEQADFLAYHDALTGLANRALFTKVLDRAAERARLHGLEVALLNVDLDSFKKLNDTYGHVTGDQVLQKVAERLRATARSSDLIVRQGGDEFAVVMSDVGSDGIAQALALAERLHLAVSQPIEAEGARVNVRCSIGASVLGRDAGDVEALLRHADAAMYRAKRIGRPVKLYQPAGDAGSPRDDGPADPPEVTAAQEAELDRLLLRDDIRAVYQPIVDLASGEVLAYEALARGPADSLLSRPDQLFAAAMACGRMGELDWACRAAAVRGALEHDLGRSRKLFVNVEPLALGLPVPEHLQELWTRAGDELDIVVEITERALASRPAELLQAAATMRSRGWGIALDDVGADVRSLALMPLLRPDVIKLDLRLVQEQASPEIAEIVNAVNAESERTGALVLAEGIETEAHLTTAKALGATVGQGWLFGRPGALGTDAAHPIRPMELPGKGDLAYGRTPYEAVRPHREIRRGDKRLLIAVSLHLEQQATALGECGIILSAFQNDYRFTSLTRRRYTRMAADAAFVAALGVGMTAEPAPGVRGAALEPDDPLLGEWSVVVLGPHFAAALVAADLGGDGPEMEREFDFALTYDRDLVIEAANALMARIAPLGPTD